MRISIGICAYNEEENIGRILDALLKQTIQIDEIYVVASGCTDNTIPIVEDYSKKHKNVKLLIEKERKGKASAVNLFLSKAKGDILVLESADTIPESNTIEELVKPFDDPDVAMVGARPVPVNSKENFVGFMVNLIWEIHHIMSLQSPKLGELIAFRKILDSIPVDTAVDEASIEAVVKKKGLKRVYAPKAIVRNRGPENLYDLLIQRERIYIGHLHLAKTQNYRPATMFLFRIFRIVINNMEPRPKYIIWTIIAIMLDSGIRLLASIKFRLFHKNPYVWLIAKSTKKL